MRGIKKALSWCDKAERTIMVAAFIVMLCTMFGSVLARNVFKATIAWFDELARISMVYMVLLGAEAGLRDGTQVRVTAVVDQLKGKIKQTVTIIAQGIMVAFTGVMVHGAIMNVLSNIERGVTTTSLNWPMAIPYMALVIGFSVAALVQTGVLVKMLMDLFKKPNTGGEELQ